VHVLIVDNDREGRALVDGVLTYCGAFVTDAMLGAGFDAHLRKPVDPWELCRTIASLARKA
jgi:CheY-like chemotaxis protein